MRASDEYLLRGFPLFRGVSDAVVDRLLDRSSVVDAQPGDVVLREGEKPESLFVLMNGLVETYASHEGETVTLAFVRPPVAFIMAAVLLDNVQLTSARVTTPSRLLVMPAAMVREAAAADLSFCAAANRELAMRYRDVLKDLKNHRMRSAVERLANWLLTESRFAGSSSFPLGVAKSVLAARLGMTSEHLSRAFGQLREYGVSFVREGVVIDPERLAAFAHPSALIDGTDL